MTVSLGNIRVHILWFQSHQLSNINGFEATEWNKAAMAADSMEFFMCWAPYCLTRSFQWFHTGNSAPSSGCRWENKRLITWYPCPRSPDHEVGQPVSRTYTPNTLPLHTAGSQLQASLSLSSETWLCYHLFLTILPLYLLAAPLLISL